MNDTTRTHPAATKPELADPEVIREDYTTRLAFAQLAVANLTEYLQAKLPQADAKHAIDLQQEIDAVAKAGNRIQDGYIETLSRLPKDKSPDATLAAAVYHVNEDKDQKGMFTEIGKIAELATTLLPNQRDALNQEIQAIPEMVNRLGTALPEGKADFDLAGKNLHDELQKKLDALGKPADTGANDYSELVKLTMAERIAQRSTQPSDGHSTDDSLKKPDAVPRPNTGKNDLQPH